MKPTNNPYTFSKSSAPFSDELFANPSSEYRGAPLWSWNTKLDRDRLLRQIDHLADMGMGGFHIHSRTGLDTEYLGPEFLELARECVNKAKEKSMLACLYDEDRWPSGYGGGKVLKDRPDFQAQHLLLTRHPYGSFPLPRPNSIPSAAAERSELGFLFATYDLQFNTDGTLISIRLIDRPEDGGEHVWYAYIEPNPPSEWFNSETYVDTFNKAAMARFIEVTHEVYKDAFSQDFGTTIPSIFTDEPQFSHKTQLIGALNDQDVFLPWTMDLRESFQRCYGHDIQLTVPEIIWDLPGRQVSRTRHQYHDHVCERFVEAFMDQLSAWCKGNGILLTGHMMEEPSLSSQTSALGEAMRCYRNLDLPGIDMLCDRLEYNTAKQASSVARQNGALGVMSEIYGVTDWTFTFADHKRSGDWQAALGVTWRVHHLTWVSMAGEAKRDYPACIGYQSPWYKEYHYVEDHFARVNVALTRGRPATRVAVIHPIESFWLCFGPIQGGGAEQEFREQAFKDLTNWLLFGLVDFDFISESLLPTQFTSNGGAQLHVGKCKYDAVILPNMRTIRSSTLDILEQFGKNGGRIIVAGEKPSLVDISPIKGTITDKLVSAAQIPWSKYHILQAVEDFRDVRVTNTASGRQPASLMYQLREEDDSRILFICNTDRKEPVDADVSIRGTWTARLLDTLTGKLRVIESTVNNDWTSLKYSFEACGSLLLSLSPRETPSTGLPLLDLRNEYKLLGKVSLRGATLSEPNVILLDRAEYKLNDGPWRAGEEVLRIDNLIREELDLPQKLDAYRQPWSIEKDKRKSVAKLTLRFKFESDIDLSKPASLALEDASRIGMVLNGSTVTYDELKSDWWVDEDIKTVELPSGAIKRGTNELLLSYDFDLLTNIERVYILGDFGVRVHGESSTLTELDMANLKFGDWTTQGLPFYAGNVTYQCAFSLPPANLVNGSSPVQNGTGSHSGSKQRVAVEVPSFIAPLLAVDLNGQRAGRIAFEPKILELGELEQGEHEISITSFGNRFNAFGTVHLPKGVTLWCGPNAWRTQGRKWQDEYRIEAMGILQAPEVKIPGRDVFLSLHLGGD